jgi:hypothetical protein
MEQFFQDYILEIAHAQSIIKTERIQSLWSGYGEILRLTLEGSSIDTVVVKWMNGTSNSSHPRGWNSDIGHQRKIRSYQIENEWYQHFAQRSNARLPHCYGYTEKDGKSLLILEDLDAAGFPLRLSEISLLQLKNCIDWFAQFHADFMGVAPNGLWKTGTYWHLATRPEELEAMIDLSLKNSAHSIDKKLSNVSFQTLVHGDAKLANFCFGVEGEVAGLDFQYVGGGCGMKDLAYFMGSCLNEDLCEEYEELILDHYFEKLQDAMGKDIAAIETEWRPLYRVAWADFHRFLKGWSPDHWKINSYSERITKEVVLNLAGS